jgi:YesN/AraC family two-component response regulator
MPRSVFIPRLSQTLASVESMAVTRVLLVDDESLVRKILKQVLAGYPDAELVGEAETGEEAIIAVDRLHPDVVVMDIRMPAMDGTAAARKIRQKHPDVKIISLSDMRMGTT